MFIEKYYNILQPLFVSIILLIPLYSELKTKRITHILSIDLNLIITNLPKNYNDPEEITFISVPHPITTKERMLSMKFVVSSWLAISPKTHVLLITTRSELDPTNSFMPFIESIFGPDRIDFGGPIKTNENNVPYVNDWFIKGIQKSRTKYVCFLNADIALPPNWPSITKKIFKLSIFSKKSPALITKRIDFNLNESLFNSIDFSKYRSDPFQLLPLFQKIVFSDPNLTYGHPCAIDSFTFKIDPPPFDPLKMPPFFMGKPQWDGWVAGLLNRVCDTITFGDTSILFHVNHFNKKGIWETPEAKMNSKIYKPRYYGDNSKTKWIVDKGFLVRRYSRSTKIPLE